MTRVRTHELNTTHKHIRSPIYTVMQFHYHIRNFSFRVFFYAARAALLWRGD